MFYCQQMSSSFNVFFVYHLKDFRLVRDFPGLHLLSKFNITLSWFSRLNINLLELSNTGYWNCCFAYIFKFSLQCVFKKLFLTRYWNCCFAWNYCFYRIKINWIFAYSKYWLHPLVTYQMPKNVKHFSFFPGVSKTKERLPHPNEMKKMAESARLAPSKKQQEHRELHLQDIEEACRKAIASVVNEKRRKNRDGPLPYPSLLLTSVNKRPTRLWPRYFPTRPKAIFFYPKGKKLKNLTFLGEIFKIQIQTIKVWPDPTRVKKFWTGPITKKDYLDFLSTQNVFLSLNKWLNR